MNGPYHYDDESGWIVGGFFAIIAAVAAAVFAIWLVLIGALVVAIVILYEWVRLRIQRRKQPPQRIVR